ncbi:glycosyltransferase, partial [bacterium]|nr:glycosyltransferase [bacterium]
FIVTIHDLIHQKSSQESSTLSWLAFYFKKLAYFMVIKSAIKRSEKIITVSNFSKQEIIKYYRVKPNKIFVTYESN